MDNPQALSDSDLISEARKLAERSRSQFHLESADYMKELCDRLDPRMVPVQQAAPAADRPDPLGMRSRLEQLKQIPEMEEVIAGLREQIDGFNDEREQFKRQLARVNKLADDKANRATMDLQRQLREATFNCNETIRMCDEKERKIAELNALLDDAHRELVETQAILEGFLTDNKAQKAKHGDAKIGEANDALGAVIAKVAPPEAGGKPPADDYGLGDVIASQQQTSQDHA